MKRILFVDDDVIATAAVVAALRDHGFAVDYASSVQAALASCREVTYDAAILDLMMPSGDLGVLATKGGFETGLALARSIRELSPSTKLVAISQRETPDAVEWFEQHASGFCPKDEVLFNPAILVRRMAHLLESESNRLRAFIVHGRDTATKESLKALLETEFGLTTVTLQEQAWRGRTIIEKFEREATDVDVVFVLLTPDDTASDGSGRSEGRVRQNVLVEIGYFLGRLSRHRGIVILLYKDGVAMPSDLDGLGYVNITNGIDSARDEIRRELSAFMRRRGRA